MDDNDFIQKDPGKFTFIGSNFIWENRWSYDVQETALATNASSKWCQWSYMRPVISSFLLKHHYSSTSMSLSSSGVVAHRINDSWITFLSAARIDVLLKELNMLLLHKCKFESNFTDSEGIIKHLHLWAAFYTLTDTTTPVKKHYPHSQQKSQMQETASHVLAVCNISQRAMTPKSHDPKEKWPWRDIHCRHIYNTQKPTISDLRPHTCTHVL